MLVHSSDEGKGRTNKRTGAWTTVGQVQTKDARHHRRKAVKNEGDNRADKAE